MRTGSRPRERRAGWSSALRGGSPVGRLAGQKQVTRVRGKGGDWRPEELGGEAQRPRGKAAPPHPGAPRVLAPSLSASRAPAALSAGARAGGARGTLPRGPKLLCPESPARVGSERARFALAQRQSFLQALL